LAAQYIREAASRFEKGSDQESRHSGADFVFKALDQITIPHIFSDQPSRAGDRSNDKIDICHLVVPLPAVREGVHCSNASCFD
jgi:2-oxoglutarate dehydrogenase complex dehydrogenase (E1) component-like enzyme